MENMTQYQKDLVRMLDNLRTDLYKGVKTCGGVSCNKCPFFKTACNNDDGGALFYAEKAIEVVNSWAKEHPNVTNEQKYKEVWGVEPKKNGIYICPELTCSRSLACGSIECRKHKEDFWTSEYKEPTREGDA